MKFKHASYSLAYSECGRFERRTSTMQVLRKDYFNVWEVETGKHIAAGFSADDVSKQCDRYLERQQ